MNTPKTPNIHAQAVIFCHTLLEHARTRFWKSVDKSDAKGCWLWRGSCHAYGAIRIGGERWLSHRLSWLLNRGPIPDGLWVLHKCDNRRCVNPDHLWLGTSEENFRDMFQKGRNAKGEKHGSHLHPESRAYGFKNGAYTHPEKRVRLPGELNTQAKLTREKAEQIRQKYANGEGSQSKLAAQYGVTQRTVCKIIHRKAWL